MKTIIIMLLTLIPFAEQPRKVLLFYNENGKERLESQMQAFKKAQDGLNERDIKVETFPYKAGNADTWKKWKVESADAFTFILVGRDGGEKLRSAEVIETRKLFGLIDAMPMRKSEIGDKN